MLIGSISVDQFHYYYYLLLLYHCSDYIVDRNCILRDLGEEAEGSEVGRSGQVPEERKREKKRGVEWVDSRVKGFGHYIESTRHVL